MVSLIEGLDILSDQELKVELLLWSHVNFMNMAKDTGNRMISAFADFANSFLQAVSNNGVMPYEVITTQKLIHRELKKLEGVPRQELIDNLKGLILAKCALTESDKLSDDAISVAVVSEADKLCGNHRYETFANKLEAVYIYYYKAYIQALISCMAGQSEEERKDADLRLQRRLDEIPIEAKRTLSKKLMPKEFSGAGIGRVLRVGKKAEDMEVALELMGHDCFDYIGAYVYTGYEAIKTFNKISQALSAQLVWKLYRSFYVDYMIDVTQLPSYADELAIKELKVYEDELRIELKKRADSDRQLEALNALIDKNDEKINETGDKLAEAKDTLETLRLEFARLDARKEPYLALKAPTVESKEFFNQVNETNRRIGRQEAEIDRLLSLLTDLGKKEEELALKRSSLLKDNEAIHKQTDKLLEESVDKLRIRWDDFYTGLSFAPEVYGQVVTNLNRQELIRVEEHLLELMRFNDSSALDQDKDTIIAKIGKQRTARIIHQDRLVTAIEC